MDIEIYYGTGVLKTQPLTAALVVQELTKLLEAIVIITDAGPAVS